MSEFLNIETLDRDAFSPFGEVVDGSEEENPQQPDPIPLVLDRGEPRFYIMTLQDRPPLVHEITRHRQVTQVLASAEHQPWVLVVAAPSEDESDQGKPDFQAIRAFSIPAGVAIKLRRGCWHAGPYFSGKEARFYNLELSDTNSHDHHSWTLADFLGYSPVLKL